MIQLLFKLSFIFYLLTCAMVVQADFNNSFNEEYNQAKKDFNRARILTAGIKRSPPNNKIYLKAIGKAEVHIDSADDHLSKARELLLQAKHNAKITTLAVNEYKQLLKKQRDDIRTLRTSINELHLALTKQNQKKSNPTIKGPKRAKAVADFLDWLDYIKLLNKSESSKWTQSEATKTIWLKASSYSGFYGIHINNISDSVIFADDRQWITQEDYDYVRNGMKRFMEFHDQFTEILATIKAAHNAGLENRQRWAEVAIRPYIHQNVFSGLPTRSVLPKLPSNPSENLGYIPTQSMMQAFNDLPKNPSLRWIKRDEKVSHILRVLYDRGLAHDFLKKFISLGGRFTVELTSGEDESIYYFPFDSTLYIPSRYWSHGKLKVTPSVLTDLMREFFHAYNNEIIKNNKDPLTKSLLTNIKIWLKPQFIRQKTGTNGSRAWVTLSDTIKDTQEFTDFYVADIINVAFATHLSIWDKLYNQSRDTRISAEAATTLWDKNISTITNTEYHSQQTDGTKWEIQTIPPDFVLDYIFAFYGLGTY